ncbi:MAG: sensor histidine kinase, partial [Bacilli bacterium]|nr:sensor histidine kinase [Bacilli bacterium]
YNIVCCLLIVYVEKALITNIDIKRENDVLIDAVNRAKKQYETQKETIDLINIKCHDLKHQIKEYGGKHSIDETNIKEINNLISIYDSSIKTNNEVLNIILTEKSLQCSSFKIRLTCMIDATDLAFISNGDMYSLFGNILDNAIEAVREVKEESKRVIALNIHTINDFVVIKIDNYYEGTLQFNEGLPMTSKSDKTSHGFGLKSVRLIVNKYDGEINLETENQIFKLTILLPTK